MRPDSYKVVHRAERAHRGPLFHGNVASQGRGVGHDDVIANRAVMRDVGVGHDKNVVTEAGYAAAFRRASIDGYELTDHVVVAHLQARRLAGIADVLRREADG